MAFVNSLSFRPLCDQHSPRVTGHPRPRCILAEHHGNMGRGTVPGVQPCSVRELRAAGTLSQTSNRDPREGGPEVSGLTAILCPARWHGPPSQPRTSLSMTPVLVGQGQGLYQLEVPITVESTKSPGPLGCSIEAVLKVFVSKPQVAQRLSPPVPSGDIKPFPLVPLPPEPCVPQCTSRPLLTSTPEPA